MLVEVEDEGRVQGVGFRAMVLGIARRHGVSGWVRNEPSGAVRLEAEASREVLETFLDDIRETMADFITAETAEWSDDTRGQRGFEIRIEPN